MLKQPMNLLVCTSYWDYNTFNIHDLDRDIVMYLYAYHLPACLPAKC
jgi:hypothetical protein